MDHVLVEKEYSKQPKKEELDQLAKEMEKAIDELKDELSLVYMLCNEHLESNCMTYHVIPSVLKMCNAASVN